jgi:PIN domain nuclease of toxin-antitoxin system
MRLLLDTHSFLWFIDNNPKLSAHAKTLIEDGTNEVSLSVASLWEIGIKLSLGKLTLSLPFDTFMSQQLEQNNIELLDLKISHVAAITNLPFHHRDPFDRLIIAQAMVEQIPVVGLDLAFDSYPVVRLW